MRLTFPLLLAACLLLPGVSALAAAPLRILAEDAASPWSNRDGSGYANDLVRAAFAGSCDAPTAVRSDVRQTPHSVTELLPNVCTYQQRHTCLYCHHGKHRLAPDSPLRPSSPVPLHRTVTLR
jgi:hypothetical protein